MSEPTITNHNSTISAAKAICIILMVIGHSGCPKQLNDIIYLFHMPCFFLVSGYLFKDKYLDNLLLFVKNKFKGIWWPFVKWSLIFAVLHNVFARIHFYDSYYSVNDLLYKFVRILTLTGSEQLLGGFWFLKELLYASIIAIISIKLYSFVFKNTFLLKNKGLVLSLLFVVLAYIISILPFKIPTIGSQTMMAVSFYLLGNFLKERKMISDSIKTLVRGGALLIMLITVSFFYVGSMTVNGSDIFIYYVVAIIGSVSVLDLSSAIKGKSLNVLDYIGDKTLYILVFHFVSFKLVSYIKILQFDLPINELSSFPVIMENNLYYWIVYSIIGVVFPLIIWNIVEITENKIKKL